MISILASALFVLLLLCTLESHVAGSGPDRLDKPPVWNFTMTQCDRFRNETVLRPRFILWPESIKGVPFRYCCEYQPAVALNTLAAVPTFDLSSYRYRPDEGTLSPAPYYDLGLVDARYAWYWQHWVFWQLPTRLDSEPLFCEVSDLRRLYMHRFWWKPFVRASETAAPLVTVLLLSGIATPLCRRRRVRWEELWSDLLHVVLLAAVGSSLMEGIGHSPTREWRSQLMFNGGVVYTYLTLFAIASSVIRHAIRRRSTRANRSHAKEAWRWQKVFGQFAAQFMVGAYLILVDDAAGRRLEGLACLVLGTVVGATIYSAGVELYVISQFFHFKHIVKMTKGDSGSDSGSNSPAPNPRDRVALA